jgi:PAS domain S-box-containing protein
MADKKAPSYAELKRRLDEAETALAALDRSQGKGAAKTVSHEYRYTDDALRDSQLRLIEAQRMAKMGDFTWDVATGEVTWSEAMFDLLGYHKSEKINYTMVNAQIHHPDDLEGVTRWLNACVDSGGNELTPHEYRLLRKDGDTIHARTGGVIMRGKDGAVKVFATVQDITERKLAEQALIKSERILNAVSAIGRIGGWEHDLGTGAAIWTKALYDIIEIPQGQEPPGVNQHLEYYLPKDREIIARAYERAIQEGVPFDLELRAQTAGGRLIWCRAQGEPVFENGKCVKIRGVFQDITKRKKAELEQEKLWDQLSTAMEIALLGYWEYDVTTDLFTFNDYFYNMLRTTVEQVGGYTMSSQEYAERFAHPEDRRLVEEEIRKALGTLDADYRQRLEHRIIFGDGTEGYISVQIFLVKDPEGRTIKTYGVNQDITERKRTEEELKKRNKFIEMILDYLPIGLGVNYIDSGEITYINHKFEEIYGWPKEDLSNISTFFDKMFVNPEIRNLLRNKIMADIASGDPDRMMWENLEITTKGGQKKVVLAKNIPIFDQNIMISTVQDFTEKRSLEVQLRQAQKMEAVGTLAGGIAHDFNNILAIINGYGQLALGDLEVGGKLAPSRIKGIMQAVDRAKELVRQVLTFSRKGAFEPKPLDLNQLVADTAEVIRRTIPKMISVETRLKPGLWLIKGDYNQIEQILLNLTGNARDAMPQGGKLVVETANLTLEEELAKSRLGATAGDYVVLTVTDTGMGMDSEALMHIFEPFYTTKEVGKGTGLGLAMVYGIMEDHNGYITCDSAPGVGTAFEMFFPIMGMEMDVDDSQPDGFDAVAGGSEAILLVDDEQSLRESGAIILQSKGYQVMTAENGEEALKLYGDKVDLAIMDLGMPGRGGIWAIKDVIATS